MKISVSGKGGSGKTTISGTLARVLARRGRQVLAIDADTNPNMALSLGLSAEVVAHLPDLPSDLLQDAYDEAGKVIPALSMSMPEVIDRYGAPAPDGVRLLTMRRIEHAGLG